MIRASQIPPEVEAAIWATLKRDGGATMAEALAAGLVAWQTPKHKAFVGSAIDEVGGFFPAIIRPLPQEVNDE